MPVERDLRVDGDLIHVEAHASPRYRLRISEPAAGTQPLEQSDATAVDAGVDTPDELKLERAIRRATRIDTAFS
jgi:hypothetical protein